MARLRGRLLMLAAVAVPLAACGTTDDPPLPGERIAILSTEQRTEADARIADLDVRLPAPVSNKDWPQQGGEPWHAMQHVELADVPALAWQADIGTGSDSDAPILSGPIVADGMAIAMDASATVSAYDIEDGTRLWRTAVALREERDGSWGGGTAYDDGTVYVATGFAQAVALDAKTGEERWRQSVSGPMRAAPTVADDRVFVVTHDNQLHALDADTGELLWSHTGIVESAGLLGGASPAAQDDIVVAPYSSGEVFALRVENGRPVWSDSLAAIRRVDAVSALADIRGRPVIDGGRVYAISHSGRMVAIDLRTGRRVWEADVGSVQQPWVAGDFIFVLTTEGEVVAMTAVDGRIRWVTPIGLFEDPEDRDGRIAWAGPVLAGDRLIVNGSHGQALSLSPYTGEILGWLEISGGSSVGPAVADETLLILSDSARLLAFR